MAKGNVTLSLKGLKVFFMHFDVPFPDFKKIQKKLCIILMLGMVKHFTMFMYRWPLENHGVGGCTTILRLHLF